MRRRRTTEAKKITAESVWSEYEKGESYHTQINLHDRVKRNEQFYNGDQWEGVNAPDLEKPVINVFHPAVTFLVSQIVSDDVGVDLEPFVDDEENSKNCEILMKEIDRIAENEKEQAKGRELVRDAAVDGDGCFHYYFDPYEGAAGEIKLELLDNDKVIFANPFLSDVQKQRYIIIAMRMTVEEARERAKREGISESEADSISPDISAEFAGEDSKVLSELCTVLRRYWFEGGRLCYCESTKEIMLKSPTKTGRKLYPVAWMPWEKVKNSYHGAAAMTPYIQNQIYINKMWALAATFTKRMAFPTRFYNQSILPAGLSNKIGQAIGVSGNPRDAVFVDSVPGSMSVQVLEMVDKSIAYMKESMGVTDAALGNLKMDNASAIIALSEAATAPLIIQRLGFHQCMEDAKRIVLDLMREYYGIRNIVVEETNEAGEVVRVASEVDFKSMDFDSFSVKVNVGTASYCSELMQVQTLDALFRSGVISDAITYLEEMPDGYIRHKPKLIKVLKEQRDAAQQELEAANFPPSEQPEQIVDPAAEKMTEKISAI